MKIGNILETYRTCEETARAKKKVAGPSDEKKAIKAQAVSMLKEGVKAILIRKKTGLGSTTLSRFKSDIKHGKL